MKALKQIVLILLLTLAGFYIYQSQQNSEISQLGAIAPNFLEQWFEKEMSLDPKKHTLYIAWASSCPKCIINSPKYNNLLKKYKKRFNVIGISPDINDGSKEMARQYSRFPMNYDPKLLFFKYFGISSFPYYVIIDKDKTVLDQGHKINETLLIRLSQ
ncbi:TlpA family protein disulfide reductase [bacterium]|nr:TlpA family protein disulfide reductase [bacterium]